MSHIVEATYENGVLKLAQALPLNDREKVRVTIERLGRGAHSVFDIRPISLGQVLRPLTRDDDVLGEMLEGRG
ncbi:MAG: antitoxin family protein [Planctomycetota bacterium]|nr:antitoxin family protein [Planctomycetota bacterium]